MPLENLSAGVVLLALFAYAVLGGADFGGGIWTALPTGPRAAEQRQAILRAIGPVWEANHVWLILVVVALFTAFPPAFADLFTALTIPLVIALVGIVFRGSAFAFRHYAHSGGMSAPATGAVFALASLITPLVMGMALGAVVGGHVAIEGGVVTSGLYEPWLHPFPIVCGLIAVAVCSLLSACYLTVRTSGPLQEDFRSRAVIAGLLLGALMIIALPVAYWDADPFWDELVDPAPIAVMCVAAMLVAASLVVLWRRWYSLAPPVAAATIGLLMAGWAAAQYPYLILPNERISDAAATDATLAAFLIALAVGALILIPALGLLYLTFTEQTGGPGAEGVRYEY